MLAFAGIQLTLDLSGQVRAEEQLVGTSPELITLDDVGTPSLLYLQNRDSTNFVDLSLNDVPSQLFARLYPGGIALWNPGAAIYAQADTAQCIVSKLAIGAASVSEIARDITGPASSALLASANMTVIKGGLILTAAGSQSFTPSGRYIMHLTPAVTTTPGHLGLLVDGYSLWVNMDATHDILLSRDNPATQIYARIPAAGGICLLPTHGLSLGGYASAVGDTVQPELLCVAS
jgi:hypothetical protein